MLLDERGRGALLLIALTASACASTAGGALAGDPVDSQDLNTCRETVSELRVQVDQQQRKLRGLHPEVPFATGQPLPALAEVLRQAAAEALSDMPRAAPASYGLSCRTWICCLEVHASDEHFALAWAPFGDRLQRTTFDRRRKDVDPTSGATVFINSTWLVLRHPTGEPRTSDQIRDEARAAQPPPADVDTCRASAKRLGAQRRHLAAQLAMSPEYDEVESRFEAGTPDAGLTAMVSADLARLLALPPAKAQELTSCRASICLVDMAVVREQLDTLLDDERFGSRVEVTIHRVDGTRAPRPPRSSTFFVLSPTPRASGRKLLVGLLNEAEREASKCDGLAPKRGALTVRVELRAAGEGDPQRGIQLELEGSLRNTPRGRCIAEIVEAKLNAATIPRAVSGHKTSRDFLYAR
jgi:hypothetical protein